jgi:hypothetical protein
MQIVVFYILINSAFVGGDNLYLSKCTVEQQLKPPICLHSVDKQFTLLYSFYSVRYGEINKINAKIFCKQVKWPQTDGYWHKLPIAHTVFDNLQFEPHTGKQNLIYYNLDFLAERRDRATRKKTVSNSAASPLLGVLFSSLSFEA